METYQIVAIVIFTSIIACIAFLWIGHEMGYKQCNKDRTSFGLDSDKKDSFQIACEEYIQDVKFEMGRKVNIFIHELEQSKEFELLSAHKITESLRIISEKYKNDKEGCLKALKKWNKAIDTLNKLHNTESK